MLYPPKPNSLGSDVGKKGSSCDAIGSPFVCCKIPRLVVQPLQRPTAQLRQSTIVLRPGQPKTAVLNNSSWEFSPLTPALGCGVFLCFLIIYTGDLLIFNLPFPLALCPYQMPLGIASLPAYGFPLFLQNTCYEIQLLRDVVKIDLLGKESHGLSRVLILFHGQEFIVDLNLRPGNISA